MSHRYAGDPGIHGLVVAMLTPFTRRGALDPEAVRRHVEYLASAGVDGLFVCGTNGEAPLLAHRERTQLAELVVAAAAGRVPVVIQAGTASTQETIALCRHARRIGAAAVAVITPWYFRLGDAALLAHYVRVAAAVPDLPVFLYDIPQNTGNALSTETILAIAERAPNVVGVKESAGDVARIAELVAAGRGRLSVFVGNDALALPGLEAGARGSVSGNANVFPELFVALFAAHRAGDRAAARRADERIQRARRILHDGDIALFKAILARRGHALGRVRSPLPDVTAADVERCVGDLAAMGLEVGGDRKGV